MHFRKTTVSLLFTTLVVFSSIDSVFSQSNYKTKAYTIALKKQFSPAQVKTDFFVHIQNNEAVFEGNKSYQSYLIEIKKKIASHHYSFAQSSNNVARMTQENKVDTPMTSYSIEGNLYNGSAPNDNTMAVSNDGIVVAAINTNIIFYDTKTDSLLKTVSLNNFSDTLTAVASHQYDPKAIYDYKEDRFMMVYLAGNKSSETDIIVAFSQTADPLGEWNFYSLPGNPLNDTSWSDYPAIALNDNELIITMNLLRDGGSWQTSFKQSVVWQIDKFTGFQGDSLKTKLFHDVEYQGKNVRNVHPVRGGNAFYGPEIYLLSNHNFALESDTFYLITISDRMTVANASLTVDLLQADNKYGMPPNAFQPGFKRLATNDARVLGGFYQNGEIQFVGNSVHVFVDTDTFRVSGFYHGVIKSLESTPTLRLNIFNDDSLPKMEYGYPNISYCGMNSTSQQSIITFDYTSKTHYASFGSTFFEKDDSYSRVKAIKLGNSEIRVGGFLQRWGDYSGSQPKYDVPGEVWASGTFGKKLGSQKVYGTWLVALNSPVDDREIPSLDFSAKAYPNPPQNERMIIEFNLPSSQVIQVEIIDVQGKRVALLFDANAKAGKNTLSFSTSPLANGLYIVRITNNNELLYSQKITVIQ